MKTFSALLLTLVTLTAGAQTKDSVSNLQHMAHAAYTRHSVAATLSMGMIDQYRSNYSLPTGFQKGHTTGLAPLFVKLEYGLGKHVGLAATLGYDAFIYNFEQVYTGYAGPILRYKTNNTRIFSTGLSAYYHFGYLLNSSRRLDLFAGAGFTLDNIRYGAYPQGDSTLIKFDHTASPLLKVGARYYISDHFSLFGDAGFDRQSIISLGFSCRFFAKPKA